MESWVITLVVGSLLTFINTILGITVQRLWKTIDRLETRIEEVEKEHQVQALYSANEFARRADVTKFESLLRESVYRLEEKLDSVYSELKSIERNKADK